MELQKEIAAARDQMYRRSIKSYAEGCFDVEVGDSANAAELRLMDIVVIDPHVELSNEDFVYTEVRYKKAVQRTFRRYLQHRGSEIQLAPLNKNYRTYRFGALGEPRMAILGKVIELFRSLSAPTAGHNAANTG
jgi:SOS-response transcriptional repressor LexA